MKSLYYSGALGIFLVIVVLVLALRFWVVALNVMLGIILYLLVERALSFLDRWDIKGGVAFGILGLCSAVVVLLFILYVSFPLYDQLQSFTTQVPVLVQQSQEYISQAQTDIPFIQQASETLKESVTSRLLALFSISGAILTTLVTAPIIAGALLASRKTLKQKIYDRIPNEYFEVTVTIIQAILEHIQDYLWAKTAETLAMMVIYAIAFELIGLPQPLFLALLGGLLNIIPYLGPAITIVPVGAFAFFAGGWKLLLVSMVVLVIARVIDDTILQTGIVARIVNVHPAVVVVVTLVGGEVLGVTGLIIAIPAYVVSKIVLVGMYHYLRAIHRRTVIDLGINAN